jgi:hypothetical protein
MAHKFRRLAIHGECLHSVLMHAAALAAGWLGVARRVLAQRGGFAQIEPNKKFCLQFQAHPGWPEMPLLLI